MLRGIPEILSPELVKILCEMGHGDEIVIADANYPSKSGAEKNGYKCVHANGHTTVQILDAILKLMPLDIFVDKPFMIMDINDNDKEKLSGLPNRKAYVELAKKYDSRGEACIEYLERFSFYDRAKSAYAVVATGDFQGYSCVILKKGVLSGEDLE